MTTPPQTSDPRRRGGLGVGLGALIPSTPVAAPPTAARQRTRPARRGMRSDTTPPEAATEKAVFLIEEIADDVEKLPLPAGRPGTRWDPIATTGAWLASRRSAHTYRAYFHDLDHYLTWLDARSLDPLEVTRLDVDTYLAALRAAKPAPSPATLNRRLATLSSWYRYLLNADIAVRNPVTGVGREPVDRDFSPTVGLTVAEVRALMRAADNALATRISHCRGYPRYTSQAVDAADRDRVLIAFLAYLGLRVGEAIALHCENLRTSGGHRTVVINGKGRRCRELPLPPALVRLLDAYLADRRRAIDRAAAERFYTDKLQKATRTYQSRGYAPTDAYRMAERVVAPHRNQEYARIKGATAEQLASVPITGLLLRTSGGKPLTQAHVFATVRRLAHAAGLPAADRISPHSLRHAAATAALDNGAPLLDVQDFLGHADPRTTRRYDRSRSTLDQSPAHRLAALYTK
ncbi:tyrosine-type recombinase/integrase [Planosporangium sp. 12N6]|uniref:tyrosine-type recombinase/integrase n=1 Tax=Planosporangium spinosum TaxID=3402278 RepID=UPI003CED3F46